MKNHFKLWKAFQHLRYELFYDWLWKAGTLTTTNVNKYSCLTNDLSKTKTTDKRTSNRPIWLAIDGSKPTHNQRQTKLNLSLAANTIKALPTNHFKWTRLVTPSTDKHYLLPRGTCYSQKNSCTRCMPMCGFKTRRKNTVSYLERYKSVRRVCTISLNLHLA